LESEPTVAVKYLGLGDELDGLDAVILPGSKTTIPDLLAMQAAGMTKRIKDYAAAGGIVLGICGGFQMMGQSIADPQGLEGQVGEFPGLGLLPFQTVMAGEKVVQQRQVETVFPQAGWTMQGYEIHLGRSEQLESTGFKYLFNDKSLGVTNQTQTLWGSYLHGIFEHGAWRRMWLNQVRQCKGLRSLPDNLPNYADQREALINLLANHMTEHLNLTPIFEVL
jgi:adenosylcobyric acid synthase